MKLFSLLPKRLVHLACNSPRTPLRTQTTVVPRRHPVPVQPARAQGAGTVNAAAIAAARSGSSGSVRLP